MKESSAKGSIIGTRAHSLTRLESFKSLMGKDYEKKRNYDFGPDDRSNISVLSPYVRARLILEEELVKAALSLHLYKDAEKFIQEVFWRAYWKGWLELRPKVWDDYLQSLLAEKGHFKDNTRLEAAYFEALEAETPYECFNFWVKELKTKGYLHNHARMWFASIWIFYLKLPWQLGAEFFYVNLIDGDAASNTLSWRWVAGLQTINKTYIATAQNINKFTSGRFNPPNLFEPDQKTLLIEPCSLPLPLDYKRAETKIDPSKPLILFIYDEDLYLESSPFSQYSVSLVIGLSPKLIEDKQKISGLVFNFRDSALKDGVSRSSNFFNCEPYLASSLDELYSLIKEASMKEIPQIAFMKPRTGFWKEFLDNLSKEFNLPEITFTEAEREWDAYLNPHAKKGFFKFKEHIPAAIERLKLNS